MKKTAKYILSVKFQKEFTLTISALMKNNWLNIRKFEIKSINLQTVNYMVDSTSYQEVEQEYPTKVFYWLLPLVGRLYCGYR